MYIIKHKEFKNYYGGSKQLKKDDCHFHMVMRKDEATRLSKIQAKRLLNKKKHPSNFRIIEVID